MKPTTLDRREFVARLLTDRGHRDAVDRVELVDWHSDKPTACFEVTALGKDTGIEIQTRAELRTKRRSEICRRP